MPKLWVALCWCTDDEGFDGLQLLSHRCIRFGHNIVCIEDLRIELNSLLPIFEGCLIFSGDEFLICGPLQTPKLRSWISDRSRASFPAWAPGVLLAAQLLSIGTVDATSASSCRSASPSSTTTPNAATLRLWFGSFFDVGLVNFHLVWVAFILLGVFFGIVGIYFGVIPFFYLTQLFSFR